MSDNSENILHNFLVSWLNSCQILVLADVNVHMIVLMRSAEALRAVAEES